MHQSNDYVMVKIYKSTQHTNNLGKIITNKSLIGGLMYSVKDNSIAGCFCSPSDLPKFDRKWMYDTLVERCSSEKPDEKHSFSNFRLYKPIELSDKIFEFVNKAFSTPLYHYFNVDEKNQQHMWLELSPQLDRFVETILFRICRIMEDCCKTEN